MKSTSQPAKPSDPIFQEGLQVFKPVSAPSTKTDSAHNLVDLAAALPTLAADSVAVAKLRKRIKAADVEAALKMMRKGVLEGDIGDEVHDFFLDEITNESVDVWSGVIISCSEEYATSVKAFAGVFWVFSVDYDRVGFFLSRQDAVDFIYFNWDEVEER